MASSNNMLADSVLDHQSTALCILQVRTGFCSPFKTPAAQPAARARSSTTSLPLGLRIIKNYAYLALRDFEEWTVLKEKKRKGADRGRNNMNLEKPCNEWACFSAEFN